MNGLRIEPYESVEGAAWNAAVTELEGSFYHLYGWRAVNAATLGHRTIYLGALHSDRLVGLLPLVSIESRAFGRIMCSMPFVNFGGPCAMTLEVQSKLVQAAMHYADDGRADYLELRCTHPIDLDLPVSQHKISMTVQLDSDPEALWSGFTHKHRKNVRRAYKNDLSVVSGGIDLLTPFYRVLQESWRNLGTPLYTKHYFHSVLSEFGASVRIFICRRSGAPIAAALTGYHNGTCEGLWAGGVSAARQLDANYVLYWEMIRDACLRGCRRFHLGRSTAHSGGEEFKSRWNAAPEQLYWYYYLPHGGDTPALNVNNPKYRLAIKAWRHMPLWCTRVIGPPIARYIP